MMDSRYKQLSYLSQSDACPATSTTVCETRRYLSVSLLLCVILALRNLRLEYWLDSTFRECYAMSSNAAFPLCPFRVTVNIHCWLFWLDYPTTIPPSQKQYPLVRVVSTPLDMRCQLFQDEICSITSWLFVNSSPYRIGPPSRSRVNVNRRSTNYTTHAQRDTGPRADTIKPLSIYRGRDGDAADRRARSN